MTEERLWEIGRKLRPIHGEWALVPGLEGPTLRRLWVAWRSLPAILAATEELYWEVRRMRAAAAAVAHGVAREDARAIALAVERWRDEDDGYGGAT